MEALKNKVNQYLAALGVELPNNKEILVDMLIERTQVYLNRQDVDIKLAGVLAQILKENNDATLKNGTERVASISDNGQSMSFVTNPMESLINASDQQLFASHTAILNRYRKLGTLRGNSTKNETTN